MKERVTVDVNKQAKQKKFQCMTVNITYNLGRPAQDNKTSFHHYGMLLK